MKGTFVFVVCGAKEHIDTLHFSLRYLQRFSSNEVLVLTDPSRNEIPVVHSNVIDVKTPEQLDHHQASIYLKVGIHNYLPKGKLYCYLDTDVVAISEDVDSIFDEFIVPVRFAADHSPIHKFSSRAVNCGCLIRKRDARLRLEKAWQACSVVDPLSIQRKLELEKKFEQLEKNPIRKKITDWRYSLARQKFRLNCEFWFDKLDRVWYDSRDVPVLFEDVYDWIERKTELKYKPEQDVWVDFTGIDIWLDDCYHLVEQIKHKFDINVSNAEWQHWNGGVFLFNDSSHEFLSAWSAKTMAVFEDSEWKTRDQGTLIATVWEFGLQDHSVLDKKWNFIADRVNEEMKLNEATGEFTDDGFKTSCHPVFAHIFHDFGDTNWYIWNWIERKGAGSDQASWSS